MASRSLEVVNQRMTSASFHEVGSSLQAWVQGKFTKERTPSCALNCLFKMHSLH